MRNNLLLIVYYESQHKVDFMYLDILIYSNEVGFIDVCWCYWVDLYLFSSVAFSVIAVVLINKKCLGESGAEKV